MAAGAIGYGRELMRLVDLGTLGALVTRVTTLHREPGSLPPRLAGTAAGVLIGPPPNPGLRAVVREYAPTWATWPLPVILAVAGQSPAEYARIGSQVDGETGGGRAGAGPVSSQPEPGRPHAGWDPAEAWQAVHALREACSAAAAGQAAVEWSGPGGGGAGRRAGRGRRADPGGAAARPGR